MAKLLQELRPEMFPDGKIPEVLLDYSLLTKWKAFGKVLIGQGLLVLSQSGSNWKLKKNLKKKLNN